MKAEQVRVRFRRSFYILANCLLCELHWLVELRQVSFVQWLSAFAD